MKDSIWDHNAAKFVKECKRLRALCQRIIDGQESVIEGSRQMCQYRFRMKEEENEDWDVFAGVDTETDHLPVGAVRQHWAKDALVQKDKEIEEIENAYRSLVIDAAKKIRDEYEQYVNAGDVELNGEVKRNS